MTEVAIIEHSTFDRSVPRALDAIGAASVLAGQETVLLKPNLVNASPPPITTPVDFVREVARYARENSKARIVVAEGCGDPSRTMDEIFAIHGYKDLAHEMDLELVDLNKAPLATRADASRPVFKEMHLPKILFESFVISLPVLKAHSLSTITGAMKNMVGACPPEHYSGSGGYWLKAVFHNRCHQSIKDLIHYRAPDLSVMDATVGMADFHLGGATCAPPVNKILASFDPVRLDREAAGLLGLDWRDVAHLR